MNMIDMKPYVADGLTLAEIRQDMKECNAALKSTRDPAVVQDVYEKLAALARGEAALKRHGDHRHWAPWEDADSLEGRTRYLDAISRSRRNLKALRRSRDIEYQKLMLSRMFVR